MAKKRQEKGKISKQANDSQSKEDIQAFAFFFFFIVVYSKSCHSLSGGGGSASADLHLMLLLTVGGLNWGTKEQVYANVNLPFHPSLMQ